MNIWKTTFVTISASLALTSPCIAQDFNDEFTVERGDETANIAGLLNEKIVRISANKKFFILTNDEGGYGKGDFISIIFQKKLTARALVAKDESGMSGIKILKIYSMNNWNQMRPGLEIQILRGDDSYYQRQLKEAAQTGTQDDYGIAEEDLSELTSLEDGLELEEPSRRVIKTDNLLFGYFGAFYGQNNDGSKANIGMFSGSWAYQIADNIWAEATVGQAMADDYPAGGIDTTITTYSLRLKYTVAAPFYSYIQPYIGYYGTNVDSPGAGEGVSGEQRDRELELVDDLKKSTVIFGVSILKRLVPGWFIRADLGTDTMAVGFGLEF